MKKCFFIFLTFFTTQLFSFQLCGDNVQLHSKAPNWVKNPKDLKIFTKENCAVLLQDGKIAWFSKYIEVNGAIDVFDKYDDSTFSYGELIFEHSDKTIGEQHITFDSLDSLNGAIISIKTSMHNLKQVNAYYKGGQVSQITYKFPFKNKNKFILYIEFGKKPH